VKWNIKDDHALSLKILSEVSREVFHRASTALYGEAKKTTHLRITNELADIQTFS
jgi:hypothetical protein